MALDRGKKGHHNICHSGAIASIQRYAISSWAFIVFNLRLHCSKYFVSRLCCEL